MGLAFNGWRRPVAGLALKLAVEHRAGLHCRDLHAWNLNIDAELRRSVNLNRSTQALGGPADQFESFESLSGTSRQTDFASPHRIVQKRGKLIGWAAR